MRPLVIWIVEDQDDDARKAYEVALQLAREKWGDEHAKSVKIYRVKVIEWPPELRLVERAGTRDLAELAKATPAIVVLDLFDNGVFKAQDFLQALRGWEQSPTRKRVEQSRSFVILWTVRSNLDDVSLFLRQERERDRRINFTETKNRVLLREQLEGFWRQWEEEKHP